MKSGYKYKYDFSDKYKRKKWMILIKIESEYANT